LIEAGRYFCSLSTTHIRSLRCAKNFELHFCHVFLQDLCHFWRHCLCIKGCSSRNRHWHSGRWYLLRGLPCQLPVHARSSSCCWMVHSRGFEQRLYCPRCVRHQRYYLSLERHQRRNFCASQGWRNRRASMDCLAIIPPRPSHWYIPAHKGSQDLANIEQTTLPTAVETAQLLTSPLLSGSRSMLRDCMMTQRSPAPGPQTL